MTGSKSSNVFGSFFITCKEYYCSVLCSGAVIPYSGNTAACGNCGAQNWQLSTSVARGWTCFTCGHLEVTFNSTVEVCVAGVEDARPESPKLFQRKTLRVSWTFLLFTLIIKRTGVYFYVGVQPVSLASPRRIIKFLVDTGSAVSIMKEQSFQNLFRDQVELKKSQPTLLDFSRRKIPVRGQFPALTVHKSETAVVTFHITKGGTSLLGIDAVQAFGLQIVGTELHCLTMAKHWHKPSKTLTQGPKMHPQHSNKLSPPTTKPRESEEIVSGDVCTSRWTETSDSGG